MLAIVLAFLGTVFDLCLDVIFKILATIFVLFLLVLAIATGFAAILVALLT